MNWIFAAAAGLLCGIISGFGIGGGTPLILYMVHMAGLSQQTAQGINLLYFIPTSSTALISHFKNKLICKPAILPTVLCGVVTAVLGAFAATAFRTELIQKLFGGYLVVIGLRELLKKQN